MEIKEKIDLNKSLVDIIHKKILILLGAVAGTWVYGLEFIKNDNGLIVTIGLLLFIFFVIFLYGLALNYIRLNELYKKIEELENE